MTTSSAVAWGVIVARLRHDLADLRGRRWSDKYLKDRALDFVEWALERRPELFEATRIVEVRWPLSLPPCCVRITQIFAEVNDAGQPIAEVNVSARRPVAYSRRMCDSAGKEQVRFAIDQASRGSIVADRPFDGTRKLMVQCVARPKVTKQGIELPPAVLPLLYEWVTAKVMGVDHDSATAVQASRLKEQAADAAVTAARRTTVEEVKLARSATP